MLGLKQADTYSQSLTGLGKVALAASELLKDIQAASGLFKACLDHPVAQEWPQGGMAQGINPIDLLFLEFALFARDIPFAQFIVLDSAHGFFRLDTR